jgi:nucleoside 2-deoxyribosyltransferase
MRFIYVSGPITKGMMDLNCRNGILVAERLRQLGFVPFCPHVSIIWNMVTPVPYEGWMTMDLAWVERCDAVLRMPGESPGADREVAHALAQGKPVFYSVEALQDYVARQV